MTSGDANGLGVFLQGDDFGDAIGNRIGGTTPAARNLISGNNRDGVLLARATGNVVEGNLVGTDASGKVDLGNNGAGVFLGVSASSSRVGGTTPAARNVISGNNSGGVSGGDSGKFNQVQGNFIGTDIAGTQALGKGAAAGIS